MATKRKRGPNYTPQETQRLLELVSQHYSIIEEKRTTTVYLLRKKQAWEKICDAYNTFATSGLRTVEQLKVLYDNKKQKARRVIAEKNGQCQENEDGNFCPKENNHNTTLLDVIKNQITPPSSQDRSKLYVRDFSCDAEDTINHNQSINVPSAGTRISLKEDIAQFCETSNEPAEINVSVKTEHISLDDERTTNVIKTEHLFLEVEEEDEETDPIDNNQDIDCIESINMSTPSEEMLSRHKLKQRGISKNKIKDTDYKQLYFKLKAQNASLERRRLYQEIRMRQREHSLVMKVHETKLQFLKEEHEAKLRLLHN